MREPLNQFAARIVRCAEVEEFIEGLCLEHGVNSDTILRIGHVVATKRDKLARGSIPLIPGRQSRPIGRDSRQDGTTLADIREFGDRG